MTSVSVYHARTHTRKVRESVCMRVCLSVCLSVCEIEERETERDPKALRIMPHSGCVMITNEHRFFTFQFLSTEILSVAFEPNSFVNVNTCVYMGVCVCPRDRDRKTGTHTERKKARKKYKDRVWVCTLTDSYKQRFLAGESFFFP